MTRDLVLEANNAMKSDFISSDSKNIIVPILNGVKPSDFSTNAADNYMGQEVVLFGIAIDDSTSISDCGNTDKIIKGFNIMLDAIQNSKEVVRNRIFMHTRYLNGKVLFPFSPFSDVIRMTQSNYIPNGNTPLYDTVGTLLASVLLESQKFYEANIAIRTVTVFMTDGADYGSNKIKSPEGIRPLVEDMLKDPSNLIIAYGVDDGKTDFNGIFSRMGIHKNCIITSSNSESEIRRVFNMISKSVKDGVFDKDVDSKW